MRRRYLLLDLLTALLFIAGGVFILTYQTTSDDVIDLDLRDVAPRDISASQQFSYISNSQTQAARDRARNSIATIDRPPDTSIARKQVKRLQKIFDYLDTVRSDPYGTLADKSDWIAAIPDLTLSDVVVDSILVTTEETWAATKQEALNVLNQAMRTVLKENQLPNVRRQLPTLVALDTPDDQSSVIVAIVEDMIQANTFPDEARTETEREAAAAAIEDILVTVEENELIISAGEIVTEPILEKLEALARLQQPEFSQLEDFVPPVMLMVLTTIVIGVYLAQYLPRILIDGKRLIALVVLLLMFIAIAKFVIPSDFVYLYPIAALTMLTVIIIDVQFAFILTTILALLIGYMATSSPQIIVVYMILSGWAGAMALGRSQRVMAVLWAGVYVALTNLCVIFIFHLPSNMSDYEGLASPLLQGLLNGILLSAGLAVIGLFIIGGLVGITTSIQLSELARPTHPLLRQLLLKAPGTYAHSLMVSNLGEQAAERIGADSMLVRVMAYYHDIGKIQRPYFFVENQPEGINVHEKLEPQISAQIIISHVTDGLELAKKYRLPTVIKNGIAQHQGTDLVKYFYYQALKAAEEKNIQVDENHFRYPGPKPQTKETGILMLADISETSVRALKPGSAEEIDQIVRKMISDKLESGELDECNLTIADLHDIRTAFVDILQGVHHPRIKYPDQTKAEEGQATSEQASQKTSPAATGSSAAPSGNAPPRLQPLPADGQTQPPRLVRRE